uniref:Uncharacterized protein n=1 Tax=uncultured marine virus TaxID=186617 RepID=A0A0F7LAY3_9VIRU|nr:hypothetical protein [uncultured marine virus]
MDANQRPGHCVRRFRSNGGGGSWHHQFNVLVGVRVARRFGGSWHERSHLYQIQLGTRNDVDHGEPDNKTNTRRPDGTEPRRRCCEAVARDHYTQAARVRGAGCDSPSRHARAGRAGC